MGLFSRPARAALELLDTTIGPTANFSGTLKSDGGLRIDGHFEGYIEVAGNVVVGESGRVMADISGRNITVAGLVKGNITGTGRLEILATGQVIGDITVASVMIDDGGMFQGVSRMLGYEQRALAPPQDRPANGSTAVYVEEPRAEPVTMVELTARQTPEPEAPVAQVAAASSPAVSTPANSRPKAPPVVESEIDFDDIEPVIPDIVIEPPPTSPPPTDNRRRTRR